MPSRAMRPCFWPGCRNTVTKGRYCDAHRAVEQRQRGTSAQRGYDYRWQKIRALHLQEFPLCADPFNVHDGAPPLATDVDHIQRKRDGGTNDPSNLQSLCHSCHSRKTRAEMGEGGIKSLEADEPRPHVGHAHTYAKFGRGVVNG